MKLIDKNALANALEMLAGTPVMQGMMRGRDFLPVIAEAVRKLPVADAVQVVRCKDCVCNLKAPSCLVDVPEDAGWCMLQGHVTRPDDFCSNGEKMGDGHDKG